MKITKKQFGLFFLGISVVSIVVSVVLLYKIESYLGSSVRAIHELPQQEWDIESTPSGSITIDVAGAVQSPGVYTIPAESRLHEALSKAGGLLPNHDAYTIAKQFNLAKKLKDEEKIYIPYITEAETGETETKSISINTASKTQLELLPKIGPVTAQKIIDGRSYGSLDELVSKKIVNEKLFDTIKEMVSL